MAPAISRPAARVRRAAMTVAIAGALVAAVPAGSATAVPDAAPTGLQTGTYKASGSIAFRFRLVREDCFTRAGKPKFGLCLSAWGDPRVEMDCPDGEGLQPDYTTPVVLPHRVLMPTSGRLTEESVEYFSNGAEAGRSTFTVVVKKNGRASGTFVLDEVTTWGTPATCTSGALAFTARRK